MSDLITVTKVRASTTGSIGRSDLPMHNFPAAFNQTNGAGWDDPFFRLSPALAVGDDYTVASAERAKGIERGKS